MRQAQFNVPMRSDSPLLGRPRPAHRHADETHVLTVSTRVSQTACLPLLPVSNLLAYQCTGPILRGEWNLGFRGACLGLFALPLAGALQAQAIKNEPPMRHFTDEEVAAIAMPAIAFEPTPEDVSVFDKYFFFHRPETSFDEAYADVVECDALSSGISIYMGADSAAMASAMTQYGAAAGAAGGMIASIAMDLVFGSAARRAAKRTNMRNCMYFKGYDRYGLAKDLWRDFNFEEGNGREAFDVRERDLRMQARVASGPAPSAEVLAP